ncbi:MAG TPA: hypothetical protein VNH11_07075 [Pirellulales bacterium]|nr:hypothetical protein [Pirellulales bacterium]
MPSLANLDDLRSVLGRLNAERPAVQRAELGRTLYEVRGDDFLKRLDLDLRTRQGKARVLVTGQIGVGKSSELGHCFSIGKTNRTIGFPVYCDLEKQESPERCNATGVLLTMLRDCWAALDFNLRDPDHPANRGLVPELISIRDEILSRLIDHFSGRKTPHGDEVVFRFGGMDFVVSLLEHRKSAALALILGKASQHEAVSEPAERFGVAPDTLVILLNQMLRWMRKRFGYRPPTLLVDHVDKIRDSSAAEDVLVRAFTHWERIEASIVMTAPYEFTLGELRNSVESRWGPSRILYPLDIPESDRGAVLPIFKNIAKSAGLGNLVPIDSLRLTAHYSGGILRPYVQLLIESAKEAHFLGHDVIEPTDALSAIHALERAYQDYSMADFSLLEEVTSSGTGLRSAVTLLRSPIGLIVRQGHDGEQQLEVHPLARRALERYQRKAGAVA